MLMICLLLVTILCDVNELKSLLSKEFDMKDLGPVKKIFGMEIHRNKKSKRLWLSQQGYVEKVLDKFNMSNAKPVSTSLPKHFKLYVDQCLKIDVEVEYMSMVTYANVVGCLMYAMVCTRPNLAHIVSQVCKFMSNSVKRHCEVMKWILRYLKGTIGHDIMFDSQQGDLSIAGYVDCDYVGDLDDRKSTT